ncbi:speckle-type POZ protein [Trichonephila inaurata madagascariensis]|uniref:Speckle-type POZ protein n=1 Tax=Trichonephila inaurata madagascariensis TaxID=2747483 RepID=A0A8X6X7N4_9ARAC|nr:speckle-type POZ protein [Trichonephila inaurata madagascariensis]
MVDMTTKNVKFSDIFTYIWAIENCSKLITPDGIPSPVFEVNFLENTKWILAIKDIRQQFISYYIQREYDGGPDSIEVFFELSFLSADGFSLKTVQSRAHFKEGEYLEYAVLTEYVFELHRLQYLVNDTLTLICRMFRVRTDSLSERNMCFARTRLGLERRIFIWDIRNFSTFQPGRDVKHQIDSIEGTLPLQLAFHVDVVDGIEHVAFKVFKSPSGRFLRFNGKISILDVSGQKYLTRDFINFSTVTNVNFILCKKTLLMDNKSTLLLDDLLCIRSEFEIGYGAVCSDIEFYVNTPASERYILNG